MGVQEKNSLENQEAFSLGSTRVRPRIYLASLSICFRDSPDSYGFFDLVFMPYK